MKVRYVIVLTLLLLMAACHGPVETQNLAFLHPEPFPELSAIDSLMWQQPDSALAMLMDYFACRDALNASLNDASPDDASPLNDASLIQTDSIERRNHCVSTGYNDHYAQLLTSELLYKNDYAQTNRDALLQAVAYFDSLVFAQNATNPTNAFFAARAHYINGVGYYERDSVVEACKEYIKALETMESHFKEKELVGKKAKFMALTYTHLSGLFSDTYLHEQAIYFGEKALKYYQKHNATPWHVAWMLNEIASNYQMMNDLDSAAFYYRKGLKILPDTNSLMYRDITALLAGLFYKKDKSPNSSLGQLHHLLSLAESEKECLARCAIIGEIYYHEKQFDSAQIYLNRVFRNTNNESLKRQDAKLLVDVLKAQGRENEIIEYAEFLAPFATIDEDMSTIKSQLEKIYVNNKHQELERQHRQKIMKQTKFSIVILAGLLIVILVFLVLYRKNKRKEQNLEMKMKEEQYAHEIKQKALSRRLKQSNEALRIQKKEASDLAKERDIQQRQKEWNHLGDFMNENICQDIMTALRGKQIKREAKSGDYPELHLNDAQLHDLSVAVEKHFCGFERMLTNLYPKISRNAINQCLLYLLNLEDVQIASLLSCDYSTVKRRSAKLKQVFETEKEPRQFIREFVL